MNERQIHDAAYAAAAYILESFAPCFREEERRDAFNLAYTAVRSAIEVYEIKINRMQSRLRPGKN
jgi:hypothetical protein